MKSLRDGFGNIDIELKPYEPQPEIESGVKQTLARLVGWDSGNKTFRLVSVNSDGQISTTQTLSGADVASYSKTVVNTTVTNIVQANASRKRLIITNNHNDTLYIGFDESVTVSTGFPLNTGEQLSLTEYSGAVYGIMDVAIGDARVLEF